MVGTDAGVLNGGYGQYPGGGLGAACWVFLYRDPVEVLVSNPLER